MTSALTFLHLFTPLVLSIPTLTLFLPTPPAPVELPGIRPITVKHTIPRRQPISTSLLLLSLTSIWSTILLIADLATATTRYGNNDDKIPDHLKGFKLAAEVIFVLGLLVVYGSALGASWWRQRWQGKSLVVFAALALLLEIPNLVLTVLLETHTHGENKIFTILAIPPSVLRLLLLPVLLAAAASPRVTYEPADESSGLLAGGRSEYGTFANDSQDANKKTATSATTSAAGPSTTGGIKPVTMTKRLGGKREDRKKLSFREAMPKLRKLLPRLWPSTSIKLQFYTVMTAVTIVIERLLNPLVPISLGLLVRALTQGNTHDSWKYMWIYLGARLLNSGAVVDTIQQFFWIPVTLYTDRQMSLLCFNHLLDLSLAYHTKRNTGEVLRIIDRGSSINRVFQTMLFSVIPTFLDIVIGFSVFIWLFGIGLTGVVLSIIVPYIAFSFVSTWRRQKLRSTYIEADVKQRGISSDVLNNWESVKYFTSEARESVRFEEAVDELQKVDYSWQMGFQAIYAFQSLLLTLAFASGALIIAWNILHGRSDAAVFVIYLQYFSQFVNPLNSLSRLYREIASNVTDATKMLDLLAEKTEVRDDSDAPDLVVTDGVVEFDNVTFSYDGTTDVLKNISFTVGKGESMALVGETGSGKSTILRLLYRFYDIKNGHIYIDGQDISKVNQISLRRAIGIVPQDSVLWNDTIGANIAYSRPNATDEEVIAAAQAGMIHDKIMTFDEGYDTVVGERGVRLSGGEKQRVSLARMFLKSPSILVLDEATSALDTETEREIQKSLWKLAKGRTSLSIAHRLSTIINSDKIVVMKNGEIVEMGGYKDLVSNNGLFAKMWKHQIYTEAELLEQSDLKKIASVVPNSEGYLKAFAASGTATPKTDDPTPKDVPASPVSGSGGDAETLQPDAPTKDEDNAATTENTQGFAVDTPAETTSYADAVKATPERDQDEFTPQKEDVQAEPTSSVDANKSSEEAEPSATTEEEDVDSTPAPDPAPASYADAVKPHDEQDKITTTAAGEPSHVVERSEAETKEEESTTKPAASPEKTTATESATARPSVASINTSPTRAPIDVPHITSPAGAAGGPVPFPSATTPTSSGKAFPAPNPKRMSTSNSILSGISETASTAPSRSQSYSDGLSQSISAGASTGGDIPSDGGAKADKRRKRLSSIKGFVRRISDQGASLTRSPSGLRSPAGELPPDLKAQAQAQTQTQTRPSASGMGVDEGTRLLSDDAQQGSISTLQTQTQTKPQVQVQTNGNGGGGGNHKKNKKKKHGK